MSTDGLVSAERLREIAAAHSSVMVTGFVAVGLVDGWSIATQGHYLLALEYEAEGLTADPPPAASMAKMTRESIRPMKPHGTVVDLVALREWCGDTCSQCHGAGRVNVCKDCDGEGEIDCECETCGDSHERTCRECDGDGGERCPRSCQPKVMDPRGVLVGLAINRRLLREALAGLPGTQCRVASSEKEKLLVFGDRWRVVLMSIRTEPDEFAALQTFPTDSVTA